MFKLSSLFEFQFGDFRNIENTTHLGGVCMHGGGWPRISMSLPRQSRSQSLRRHTVDSGNEIASPPTFVTEIQTNFKDWN